MLSKDIEHAVIALQKHWGGLEFADFNKHDPWRILVSGIISHRTQDKTTFPATQRLFDKWPTVDDLSNANPDEVAKTIYPAGFYKTKGERLVQIANIIISRFKGEVPKDIENLTSIKGVGRKTANLVISFGYGLPAIVVDTHVHRICNRTGWVKTETPEQTEFKLMELVPKKFWIVFNEILVRLGQNVCRPIGPKCDICPISSWCLMQKISKSRSIDF